MKIVADADILAVEGSFNRYGELVLIPGREIKKSHLQDVDALLVRSITSVGRGLLEGTRVRFVGSATSGTDHIDHDYLANHGIGFADSRGSNANAVVDYCFSALAHAVINKGLALQSSTVGIIGAGNIGSLLANKLEQLNIAYRLCDPPLDYYACSKKSDSDDRRYYSLQETLQCNVVTLHVPLTTSGDYPTYHLLNNENLKFLPEGAVLINTSRGSVVNEAALLNFLGQREDVNCNVDVWENEPAVNEDLAKRVEIATPHIAGYSRDAKIAATCKLSQAFRNYFGISGRDEPGEVSLAAKAMNFESGGPDDELLHWRLVSEVFPITILNEQFKQSIANNQAAETFDQLRGKLVNRREFRHVNLVGRSLDDKQQKILSVLGFNFI